MKKICCILFCFLFVLVAQATSIGSWKAYMAYYDVTQVEQGGNIVYVLASENLYAYNQNDNSLQTYDKVNGLNDCQISMIKWCQAAKRLVIVYKNNNIDLLSQNGDVVSLSDYYRKTLTGDKTIYGIDILNEFAYLSTGLGVIKVNVSKAEISESYLLGFRVDYVYFDSTKIYACSSTNGTYAANLSDNLVDKNVWSRVADYTAKTSETDEELLALAQQLNPGGPRYNYFGFLKFYNNKLYSCPGGFSSATDLFRKGAIQILDCSSDNWSFAEENLETKTDHLYIDLASVAIDPTNENHLFASGRTGLYEFENLAFKKAYSTDNSPLQSASTAGTNNKDYVVVQTLLYDSDATLWMLNSIAPSASLFSLSQSGEWTSHHKSELMYLTNRSLENMRALMRDSRNLIWFTNDHWNVPSLYAYQPSSDGLNSYKSFFNQDGTEVKVTGGVKVVVEDKNNDLWIGTNVGPLLLDASEITSDSPVFQQPKIPRNDGTNYADYLLNGVDITAIAIDAANRKWFGTNGNGVYLISSDNIEEIHHFTTDNSPLLSNIIEAIAINDQTGEVFFGTDKGLCSYMSDASQTNEDMNSDNVYAYPNPVKPDYTGLITVVGLSYDAEVKIMTTNGSLVAEGRSNGGTFTWDGCDKRGKKVASGVYLVAVSTQDGNKGTVCKIAIVR